MKTPDPTKAESSALDTRQFTGTDNPRHLRSNSPELIAELRRRGLDLPCARIEFVDRDGCICRPGVYSFTMRDRRLIWAWQARMKKGTDGKRS